MSDDVAQLLARMQADFIDDLPGRCDRLEESVLALESGEPGAFDELFRNVHSLKGTGGTFGVHVITTICHQFETFIGEVKQCFDTSASNAALRYVDLLRQTVSAQGRSASGVAAIDKALEQLRQGAQSGRASVMMVDPSDMVRMLYQGLFSDKSIQLAMMSSGLAALGRLLHEPFDLLVVSRELPDLNAIAVVAALREARCCNSDIPVILVSSNQAPVPDHLRIQLIVRRDPQLQTALAQHIPEILAQR